jgi:hypothetical protein
MLGLSKSADATDGLGGRPKVKLGIASWKPGVGELANVAAVLLVLKMPPERNYRSLVVGKKGIPAKHLMSISIVSQLGAGTRPQ